MRHSERGSAIVEFAISAIFLFTLIFAIYDIGFELYVSNQLNVASQFGARYAIAHGMNCPADDCETNATELKNYVRSKMVLADEKNVNIAIVRKNIDGIITPNCKDTGCTIEIAASYTPALFLLPKPITLRGYSRLTIP